MANKQIGILFGVKGGGSVQGESGHIIFTQLNQIAKSISDGVGKPSVVFNIDVSETRKQMQKQLDTIASGLNINTNKGSNNASVKPPDISQLEKTARRYSELMNKNALGGAFDKKKFSTLLNTDDFKNYTDKLSELQVLQDKIFQVNKSNGKVSKIGTDAQLQEFINKYEQLQSIINNVTLAQQKNNKATEQQALVQQKVIDEITKYQEKYKNTLKNAPKQSAELSSLLGRVQDGSYFKTGDATKLNAEVKRLQNEIRAAGGETETLLQKGARVVKEKLGFGLAASAAMFLRQQVKQVIQTVIELDKAVVDLQIATGGTREETKAMVKEYANLARELGATTTEVAQAADTWLRQGYSVEESNELIRQSMMLSKLGQMDAADASTALTSALKGYELEATEAARITDMLVSVDMEAAASSGDIATAMSECATSARIAGVDMATLIGYLTSIKEVTQDAPESVGNFAKTMFARMGNVKLGKLDELVDGESISDVETVLNQYNIKLRDSANTFREFDDVLTEVASHWDEYSNVQQHAIAAAFAGTKQQEKFLTLMEHYDEAMGYAETATNSAGTAQEKYANAYLPSTEAAINSFKASFEDFSQSVANSDVLAFFIKLGDILLQGATFVNDWGALLPIITAIGLGIKNVGKLNNQNMPAYAQLRLIA